MSIFESDPFWKRFAEIAETGKGWSPNDGMLAAAIDRVGVMSDLQESFDAYVWCAKHAVKTGERDRLCEIVSRAAAQLHFMDRAPTAAQGDVLRLLNVLVDGKAYTASQELVPYILDDRLRGQVIMSDMPKWMQVASAQAQHVV